MGNTACSVTTCSWLYLALLLLLAGGCSSSSKMNNDGPLTQQNTPEPTNQTSSPVNNSATGNNLQSNAVSPATLPSNLGTTSSAGQPLLPAVVGTCPTMNSGMVTFQVGGTSIQVMIYRNAAATQKGPLIFYWHGTLSVTLEPIATLGFDMISRINNDGGVLVIPQGPTGLGGTLLSGTGVWYSNDLLLADQMLACALQQGLVDPTRIHVTGLSAGGIMTTQMSYLRSNYVASVASISGGMIEGSSAPASQNPANKVSAMAIHGGPSDNVFMSFQTAETAFYNDFKSKGQYALLCNHGQGHAVSLPTELVNGMYLFFNAHTFGMAPWKGGTPPAGIPSYCVP